MTIVPLPDDNCYLACGTCGGRWVDGAVLHYHCGSWLNDGETTVLKHFMQSPVKSTDFQCPSCIDKRLTEVLVNGVEVEFCVQCHGVYLDINEMGRAMPKGRFDQTGEEEKRSSLDAEDVVDGLEIASSIWSGLKSLVRMMKD